MIKASDLLDVGGKTDVLSAKAFFRRIGELGGQFHADDAVEDLVDGHTGEPVFDDEASAIVDAAMNRFVAACHTWPDPEFIYPLTSVGKFAVEDAYPGFVLDRSIPMAAAMSYQTLPGQEFPTIIVEDCNRFVAIQIQPGQGRASEATAFRIVPTSGIRFGEEVYLDMSKAELDFEGAVTVDRVEDVEEAAQRMISDALFGPTP